MLSEILFGATSTSKEPRFDRVPGISISGLFPCAYRMYRVHTGEIYYEENTPQQILNMNDGWDQEEQAVRRYAEIGIGIGSRGPDERRVVIGKSNTPGSFDGCVTLDGKRYLWEFKAMNTDRFWTFMRGGLKGFPGYRAQVQGYMVGSGTTKAIFQAKHKDSNNYHDIIEPLDVPYISRIIQWVDDIKLKNWIPEPAECEYCYSCGLKCFGTTLDFSWIKSAAVPEIVDKWKKGKQLKDVGEFMMDEARTFFVGKKDKDGTVLVEGLVGDKEVLLVEDLKILKVITHRFDISKEKIVKEFGPEALLKVGEYKEIPQYRISQVEV